MNISREPTCWQCRYFQIPHHRAFPYACTVIGFKSKHLPCYEVRMADGASCKRFMRKSGKLPEPASNLA